MITDFDLTGLSLLTTTFDDRLTALNRELRFVARTLARLRHHRHYARFSTKPPSAHAKDLTYLVTGVLDLGLQQHSPTMLKRLLFSPTKGRFDAEDIESAPADIPSENPLPKRWNTVASRPTLEQHRRYTVNDTPIPRLELPMETTTPSRRRPVPSQRPVSCGDEVSLKPGSAYKRHLSLPNTHPSKADTIPFIIDHRSQAIFHIPRKYIPAHFLTNSAHRPETLAIQPTPGTDERITHEGIYLPSATVADFADFAHWTRTGRTLPYPPTAAIQPQEWYTEACARRLISALALAVSTLHSPDYAQAAVEEFKALGPLLDWPEDYVNAIFAATAPTPPSTASSPPQTTPPVETAAACQATQPTSSKVFDERQWLSTHPARRLIVALVAGKTHGLGKERNVRLGPRRKNVECEEEADTRIRSGTFWGMYDWFCTKPEKEEGGRAVGVGEICGAGLAGTDAVRMGICI
ncbi:hypothetical protein B0A55_01924 [Friedmanniomyces simplex]|uniref:Uncharacterized protein n=1 Tax=Friedmanniomyces simplex TaxID=329884 RepID=A0A4U0Y1K9_9PEZI|nr:hypothetical protein B0A55_01924 [Friedmanniomyces simplex]